MQIKITKSELNKEYFRAARIIRQANRGLPYKVKIDPNWSIFPSEIGVYLRINYLDGNMKCQTYNIAL